MNADPSDHTRHWHWLCLHFADLPLEVFTRGLSEQAGDIPLVILSRQKVVFLNGAAKAAGIRSGNSMDTAFTFDATTRGIDRDERKELKAIRQLADWCYQFTPSVSIRDQCSLLLEVGGCLKLFGGLEALRHKIKTGLDELGHACRITSGATPLEALLLAKAGNAMMMPEVPVACMEVADSIIKSLHNMGIKLMGQLLALPGPGLEKRFGSPFADYLQRLAGKKADPQLMITPAPDFSSEINFPSDVTNFQSLAFPMKRLACEFTSFLTIRQLRVDRFTWQFNHRNHPRQSLVVRLASPINNPEMFLNLTRLQLEQFAGLPEVDNLSLLAHEFSGARPGSDDLFHDSPESVARPSHRNDPDELLLNMLRARLGPETCFRLAPADDHRPEKAWKLLHVNEPFNDVHPLPDKNIPRPSLLLASPKRLAKRPTTITARTRAQQTSILELLQGPERIDSGWWEQNTTRDYYVARHASGALYWVFQHLDEGDWYLHGYFA